MNEERNRRQGAKACVEHSRQLDVRQLVRSGRLLDGLDYGWSWYRNGTKLATIHLTVRPDQVLMHYSRRLQDGQWDNSVSEVPLERTPCHLGGERVWWICPEASCGRRVGTPPVVDPAEDDSAKPRYEDNEGFNEFWDETFGEFTMRDYSFSASEILFALDLQAYEQERKEVFAGKAMVVSMSRRIAADLYEEIKQLRPEWHDPDLRKGAIKVVMTASSADGPKLAQHHTTKEQRKVLAERMKDDADPLKLVIVRDMWLTGFDAPSMHTLYIDKPMKGHNLMQAIARVNRVYKDKPGGLVVDYLGIAADLKEALSFYSDAGGKGDPTLAQEQAVRLLLEKIEVVSAMYHGFPYERFFAAETGEKLSLILQAEEHILGLDDGRKRYINEVAALSQAFAIAVPHEQATDVKDEVGFFQAVKARLVKFDSPVGGRSTEALETTIRQVIDKALVSEQVIDVFDAAGIKKPDISILSDEFLAELKGYEHKNVALEVLKKLLSDELKVRAKRNLVQSRSLMDMLEAAIRKYQNKILTAAEVMEELIKVSKEIVAADDEATQLGLTPFEYAFYTAVANNDSARELMQKDQLRELAVVLTQRVRENASIDWTIKENVKAKLKVMVKRTLRQFGYPPDMQLLATETVLKQAEMIAEELTN